MNRRKNYSFKSITVLIVAISGLAVSGCDKAKPTTYTIPKEERPSNLPPAPAAASKSSAPASTPAPSSMQILPGMKEAAAQSGELSYKVPEGWTELPASGVRKGSFQIGSEDGAAEVSITAFPGDVGGLVANVNRWAKQVGLSPISAERISKIAEAYPISNHNGLLVSLEGETESILGGILSFHGYTWFFKMKGDAPVVAQQNAAMKEFLDSVSLKDDHH